MSQFISLLVSLLKIQEMRVLGRISFSIFPGFILFLVIWRIVGQSEEEDENVSDEDGSQLRSVVDGNTKFAHKIYFMLRDESPGHNLVVSPYSLSRALAMLRSGTGGNRKSEYSDAIQMKALSDKVITEGFSDLIQAFPDSEDIKYKSLERIFVPVSHKIREKYKETLSEEFPAMSGIRSSDFSKSVTAAEQINHWINQRTKSLLTSVISPDSISKDTKLVLLSGVAFRGNWEYAWTLSNESLSYFYVNDTHATNATLMEQLGQLKYVNLPSIRAEAVAVPFAGERLEMVVLVPKLRNGLESAEEKLKSTNPLTFLNSIVTQMKPRIVKFTMPQVDMESFWTWSYMDPPSDSVMQKLGLNTDSTNRGLLDYNGVTPYPGLYLDKIIHKTRFQVDENGLNPYQDEINEELGPVVTLKADHPFFFFIYDTETKSILLMSRKIY